MEDQMEDPSFQSNNTTNNSNLGDNSELFVEDLLDDLDSTWDIVSSRLTVSRMVSDSLIKGMVSAILDESNGKLASKEEEIKKINQELQNCKMVQLGYDGNALCDKELREKKIEELSVIKKQLRDLLEFFSASELGVHIANNEQNGILKGNSKECIEEIFSDLMKLNRMKNEDLISYFKEEIMKMKRDHDSLLQQKTEEVFVLKRELLNEKGSNPLQCENLRKKISKLLNELDEILLQNESDVTSEKENQNGLLNEKLEKIRVLDQENQELRDLIAKKEKELEAAKLFCLNSENDFGIEVEIREKVQKTVLNERFEEFEIKIKEKISRFNSQKECEFCLKNEEEREKLRQAVDSLSMQEKENFASEIEFKVTQLNRNFKSLMQYFENLTQKMNEQEMCISNFKREFNAISLDLEGILVKSHEQEEDLSGLKQKFENILDDLEKKERLGAKIDEIWVELINDFSENMLKKIDNIEWSLVNNVDCAVSRILLMKSQFDQLIKEANFVKNEKEWYKKASEMSKANLRKAETEVDLLGDEVDSLMYLLHKTFGVLKHYSYVFQHYPGVVEVLKLMEKYINGEGTKISWRENESIVLLTPK